MRVSRGILLAAFHGSADLWLGAYGLRQIRTRGLHQRVVVVGHHSVGMEDQVEPISGSRQDAEKRLTAVVAVAENDTAPLAFARRDVVPRASNSSRRGLAVPRFRFEKLASGLDQVPCLCHVRRDADALDPDAPHPGSWCPRCTSGFSVHAPRLGPSVFLVFGDVAAISRTSW